MSGRALCITIEFHQSKEAKSEFSGEKWFQLVWVMATKKKINLHISKVCDEPQTNFKSAEMDEKILYQ